MRCPHLAIAIAAATLSVAEVATAQTGEGAGTFGFAPFAGYLVSESLIEGPLGTSLGSASGPMIGGQLSLPLGSWISLVGTVAFGGADLEAGVPIFGGVSVGDTETWLFDGTLELRPDWDDGGARVIPVVQLGAGAIDRRLSVGGIEAASTDFVLAGGAGFDIPLGAGMAIRLLARDLYGKADFGSLGPVQARTDEVHTMSFSAGLRFGF
jgi:hypothetical protein